MKTAIGIKYGSNEQVGSGAKDQVSNRILIYILIDTNIRIDRVVSEMHTQVWLNLRNRDGSVMTLEEINEKSY